MGLFNLYSPGNPVVTGTTISSTWANNTLSDIATGLSTAITKNGQTVVTGDIPFGGYNLTDVGSGNLTIPTSYSASSGASLIGFLQEGTGATATTAQAKMRETISVKDFGAVGDFNPAVGTGTDDRAAIQRALTYAQSIGSCKVVFPAGNYYLGTGYQDATTTSQLLLGSRSVANAAQKIVIEGNGATIYPGVAGRALSIFNCDWIWVNNLRMIGYAGGTLGASREFDNLIFIGHSSTNIYIDGNYLSNCLGWQIGGTGDPTISGGGTGYTIKNIFITNNVLKSRYGDGTLASSGGSMTQQNIQIIDVQNCKVSNNISIGRVKFEPNLNDQYMADIDVSGNTFLSGWVTPIVPSGITNYWADEVLGLFDGAGSELEQALSLDGIPGAPLVTNVQFHDNTFENGSIIGNTGPYIVNIYNNKFQKGKIYIAADAVASDRYFDCSNNIAYETQDGSDSFILLRSGISLASFNHNKLTNEALPCIGKDANGSDAGSLTLIGNESRAYTGQAVEIGTLAASSREALSISGATAPTSWTATLTDGTNTATLSAATGYYIRNGRQISFNVRITVSALNSLGAAAYVTLPVTSGNFTNNFSNVEFFPVAGYTPTANTIHIVGNIDPNSNKCYIWQVSSTGGLAALAGTTNIGATFDCVISGSYFV